MKQKKDIPSIVMICLTATLIAGSFISISVERRMEARQRSCVIQKEHLTCVIDLASHQDSAVALVAGYGYQLLEAFADSTGADLTIRLTKDSTGLKDSLRAGKIDILAVGTGTASPSEDICVSEVDSICTWLISGFHKERTRAVNEWIESYSGSDSHLSAMERFSSVYNPIRYASAGMKRKHLTPYDSLLQEYADSIGWDWRMLAAIMFQESMFRIEAQSPRGAMGLMQMMPRTAEGALPEEMVNPRKNISACTALLASLSGRYSKIAANSEEMQKITLAAYNAGVGRMKDILGYASLTGTDTSYWDSLAAMIPEMRDSLAMEMTDAVKLGVFKGYETLAYVARVQELYDAFKKIDGRGAESR